MNRASAIIVAALVIAAALCAGVFLLAPAAARLEIAVEVAKAAIGLFPVVFFGVVVAELIKRRDDERAQRDKRRDQERALQDKRLEARRAFRDRSITAYNLSKSVRRNLRGAGFGPQMGAQISPEMLELLDQQMRRLSDAQLQLEQLFREVAASGAAFRDPEAVRTPLDDIEKYLNAVVRDWEHQRVALGQRPDAEMLHGWTHFEDFVADADKRTLPDNPSAAFATFEDVVLGELAET
jgi:hypothetical protein